MIFFFPENFGVRGGAPETGHPLRGMVNTSQQETYS
jgi:hypothetical protein